MVLEELAQAMLGLIDWGRGIMVFLIVIEIFKGLKGTGVHTAVSKGASNAGKWFTGIPGRAKRRSHKRLLNDYINEEKEEKSLDYLKHEARGILTELEAIGARGQITLQQKNGMVAVIKSYGEMLTETKRFFRSLNRSTSRANSGLDTVFRYFRNDQKMRIPEEVKALENNILKLHELTAQELTKVQDVYEAIVKSGAFEKFTALKDTDFTGSLSSYKITTSSTSFSDGDLRELIKGFDNEIFLLEDAYKKQAEAKKEMTGIIQETRDLYEKSEE